jgi:hypothetical protein
LPFALGVDRKLDGVQFLGDGGSLCAGRFLRFGTVAFDGNFRLTQLRLQPEVLRLELLRLGEMLRHREGNGVGALRARITAPGEEEQHGGAQRADLE